MGELGEVRIEVAAVNLLEGGADPPVQLRPPARFELAVQRIAHEHVLEGERVGDGAAGADRSAVDRLVEHVEEQMLGPVDDHPEDRQGERPADHGGDPQHATVTRRRDR